MATWVPCTITATRTQLLRSRTRTLTIMATHTRTIMATRTRTVTLTRLLSKMSRAHE